MVEKKTKSKITQMVPSPKEIEETDKKLHKAAVLDETVHIICTPVQVRFKKVHPDAKLPIVANKDDAGMDVCCVKDLLIYPKQTRFAETGLQVDLPKGYFLMVTPRSGLALKRDITIVNSPGIIDSGYRGNIGVILHNLGDKIRRLCKGDRVAQLVLVQQPSYEVVEVEEISDTERGEDGFGSSGE